MTQWFDRSYGMAVLIVAAAVLIAGLLVSDLRDAPAELPRFQPVQAGALLVPTNPGLPALFSPAALTNAVVLSNAPIPFVTTYFRPPPPPPPRKTRKVKLTYNGFFETATGQKRVYVLVDDKLAVLPPGAAVVADLMISNILRTELTLQQATQAVTIPFRGSKEVEVPAE